ncbi:CdaR family transcriptional regulator [Siminovitchia sediminis]|uniref:CdaR family transcriptional regulator n=1 Tax=Siminovitchia sediminis TaxID=1274353 RepID=A0ABW4KJ22_9BACI
MQISTELAQTIVTEMQEIIGQDINYMNTDGLIVASTNEERIGTVHEGGKRVAETKSHLAVEYDGEFAGAREGINLPVYFEHEIVGVIGITGEREQVEGYGKIIKRMTELLIKDAYSNKLISQQKETQRMLVEQLLTLTSDVERQAIVKRLNISNIDTNVPRVAIVAKMKDDQIGIDQTEQIFQIFHDKLVKYFDNLIAQIHNNIVIFLNKLSRQELDQILADIQGEVKNKLGIRIHIGVGSPAHNILNVKTSYEEALVAQGWAMTLNDVVKYYNDLGIELILEEVSAEISGIYVARVIGSMDKKDIQEYEEILSLFEKYNGSIKNISEQLFIHKNTLQYKLNRLHQKTGYDMRKYSDFLMLKIAFLLYKSHQ